LTTQSENDTLKILQDEAKETLSNEFVTNDGQLTWSGLTLSSQGILLEIAVSFEDRKLL